MLNYNIFNKPEFGYARTMALIELLVAHKHRVSVNELLSLKLKNTHLIDNAIEISKLSICHQFSKGFDEFLYLREKIAGNSEFLFPTTTGVKFRQSRFVPMVNKMLREAGVDPNWSVDDLDEQQLSLLESLRFSYKRQRYQIVLACALMGTHGTRPGEIAQLKKRDIKLNTGKIIFRETKGQERQDLPIHTDIYPFLRDYISYLPASTSPLFVTRSGKIWGYKNVTYAMQAFGEYCKLEEMSSRKMRPTVVMELIASGAQIPEVLAITRHKDKQTFFDHYVSANLMQAATGLSYLRPFPQDESSPQES